jgi:dihydroorotase
MSDSALDFIVSGGRILDPGSELDQVADIGVTLGRIVAVSPSLRDRAVLGNVAFPPTTGTLEIDASGSLVVPGFIDMHAHVFTGVCPLTSPADATSARSGVTTIVSAGDAGASTIDGFRQLIVQRSLTRVLAFLHVSRIGLAGWPVGESQDLDYLDVDAAVRAGTLNGDIVVGIKIRVTQSITGDNGIVPLERAIAAAELLDVPVMVHIGGSELPIGEVLGVMRPGDIVTHCFTGGDNNLLHGNQIADEVLEARERGIVFDVGHGFGSFSFPVAEIFAEAGFWPDVISTDLHSLSSNGPMIDLPTTMSKMLHLGMPLERVILAVTANPAATIKRSSTIGSLSVGREADIAVVTIRDAPLEVGDAFGNRRTINRQIHVLHTIRAGLPWSGPFPHPGVAYSGPRSTSERLA